MHPKRFAALAYCQDKNNYNKWVRLWNNLPQPRRCVTGAFNAFTEQSTIVNGLNFCFHRSWPKKESDPESSTKRRADHPAKGHWFTNKLKSFKMKTNPLVSWSGESMAASVAHIDPTKSFAARLSRENRLRNLRLVGYNRNCSFPSRDLTIFDCWVAAQFRSMSNFIETGRTTWN